MRMNIFGMVDRDCRYEGFTTTEHMIADKIACFIDEKSFRIQNETSIVLDNASVHRNERMWKHSLVWEE